MKKLILFLATIVFIVGCSEKKEEKKVEVSKEAGAIEVVENKNYKEEKVKDLETKNLKIGHKDKAYYFNYNKVETKTYTPRDAQMRVRSPYERVEISLLVSRLSKKFIVKCSACHNDYANGIIGPSLLGKDKDFIYNQIMDFKSGKKKNVLMDQLVKMMSDEEINELSSEIAEFNAKIKDLRENR
jgi:cytochrome c553